MNTTIVACTRAVTKQEVEQLPVVKSFNEILNTTCHLRLIRGNSRGLSACYNGAIECTPADWLVFVHDDVYIDDSRLTHKLDEAYNKHGFDIVGLAGCLNPTIKPHNLWHIMAERKDLRGQVAHPAGAPGQIMTTPFGPTPSRVTLIDGLFMAVRTESIKNTNWKFNENYTFHHYDLSSCIDANQAKLKIGVYPIHVVHSSPGLKSLEDTTWKNSNERFLKEYNAR
jgi:glycosyltransferase involved in cell wall biosynthesis